MSENASAKKLDGAPAITENSGESTDKKSPFFQIKDPATIQRIFNLLHRKQTLITCWTANQKMRFETTVTQNFQNLKRISIQFPVTISEAQFLEAIQSVSPPRLMASALVEHNMFFFKFDYIDPNLPYILDFHTPIEIFKLQRRETVRIPYQRKFAPRVSIFDPSQKFDPKRTLYPQDLMHFRVLDLSVKGMGFAAAKNETELFRVGRLLPYITFKVRGTELRTQGIVRHNREDFNDLKKPMLQVGVQFHHTNPEVEKRLTQYILEESRRAFSLLP